MLSLYYTGALKFNKPQTDPFKSIGGNISSSPVPNQFLGNMFGEVSQFTIKQNKPEVRAIAIKSTQAPTKTGLRAYFTLPQTDNVDTNLCDYEIGYSAPTVDNCGDLGGEVLVSPYSAPYSVTFVPGKIGFANALMLPNLDLNQYLIIWIRRKLKASAQQPLSNADLQAVLSGTKIIETLENIDLTFYWS